MLRTARLLLHAILILGGFTFLAFLAASLAYGRIPLKFDAQYVIILVSGLTGDKVPPLLASRLDKAISLAQEQDPPPEQIIVEDKAATTLENLRFSQALMSDPQAPTLVVTTGYHVFRAAILTRLVGLNARVRGARTAAYFVPSAFLREYIAIMRMNLKWNAVFIMLWAALVVALLVESLRFS